MHKHVAFRIVYTYYSLQRGNTYYKVEDYENVRIYNALNHTELHDVYVYYHIWVMGKLELLEKLRKLFMILVCLHYALIVCVLRIYVIELYYSVT